MTDNVTRRLLERRLTDVVERLSVDYEQVPLDAVIRVVYESPRGNQDVDVRDVDEATHAVEEAARADLTARSWTG